jgi:hypothetical protein
LFTFAFIKQKKHCQSGKHEKEHLFSDGISHPYSNFPVGLQASERRVAW